MAPVKLFNKSLPIIVLAAVLSPVSLPFWLTASRVNYLAINLTPLDALAAGGLLVGLFRGRPLARLACLGAVGVTALALFGYGPLGFNLGRLIYLTLGLLFILKLIKIRPTHVKWVVGLLAVGALLEFGWFNLMGSGGEFAVWLGNRRWFLSSLYFDHPNILATVILLLLIWLRLSDSLNRRLWWLGLGGLLVTGSVSALLGLMVLSSNLKQRLAGLVGLLGAGLILTNPALAVINRLLFPRLAGWQWWFGVGPGGILNPTLKARLGPNIPAGWFLEPYHNLFSLILVMGGVVGVIIFLICLIWLWRYSRWLVLALLPLMLLDHLLLTAFQVQGVLTLILARVLGDRLVVGIISPKRGNNDQPPPN